MNNTELLKYVRKRVKQIGRSHFNMKRIESKDVTGRIIKRMNPEHYSQEEIIEACISEMKKIITFRRIEIKKNK